MKFHIPFFKKRTSKDSKKTEINFVKAVKVLTKRLERANSLKMVFLRGIIAGVGTAIGATIIAGVLIWLLYQLISSLDFVPYFEDLMEYTNIDELLEQEVQSTNGQ